MTRIVAFILAFFISAGGAAALETFEKSELVIVTSRGAQTFRVEIAKSRKQQAQGLMYRRKMAADAGMIFPYPTPRLVSFWMKNTFIPLDMIFIAADGRIESIQERTVPKSLAPVQSGVAVLAVLELNGGTSTRLGIKPGDMVRHAIFGNSR